MTALFCKACGAPHPTTEPMLAVLVPCVCGNRSWSTTPPVFLPRLHAPDPLPPFTLTRDDCRFLKTYCIEAW